MKDEIRRLKRYNLHIVYTLMKKKILISSTNLMVIEHNNMSLTVSILLQMYVSLLTLINYCDMGCSNLAMDNNPYMQSPKSS